MSGHDAPFGNVDLPYRLRALGMGASVLHVGSHPDDEDAGLMAYLSRGLGVRTVYWSATRGEGGQSRVGPERAEVLGIVRTWESLDARALDGGGVLYGPFYDFGFSKSGEDCLARWDRESVLRELVRAIRFVQPQVVVSRWAGGDEDGHGQHQAIGRVIGEALDAAADPDRFPELLGLDLPPWTVQKLYRSALADWQPGEDVAFGQVLPELDRSGYVRINFGELDPISGRTYQELAWLGMNRHRTQAMSFVPRRGDYFSYYRLEASTVSVPDRERTLFDGLDPTLSGLADLPGATAGLRPLLEEVERDMRAAWSAFRPDAPEKAAPPLVEALEPLRRARETLQGRGDQLVSQALGRCLARKERELEEVLSRCLGMELECRVDEARLTPGRRLLVRTHLWSGEARIEEADFRLDVPDGWTATRVEMASAADPGEEGDAGGAPFTADFEVSIPEQARLSSPYWLREPRGLYRYVWPASPPPGLPFDDPPIRARCEARLGSVVVSMVEPAVHREGYLGGFRELEPAVVPPVSLAPRERQAILPLHGEQRLALHVAARGMSDGVEGTLSVEVPEGWRAEPERLDLTFARAGTLRTAQFDVRIPEEVKPGVYPVRYRVTSGHREDSVVLNTIWRRPPGHVGPVDEDVGTGHAFIVRPAALSVHLIDVEFIRRLRCGYIPGADEDVLASLEHFGLDVEVLPPEKLSYEDLQAFDAIVVGPNAYLVRDDVRRNATRLLDYVEDGGTLVVQYQGYGYDRPGLAPYPFRYHQPHDRVTDPEAPVTILERDHAALSRPNRITSEDFEGWVHDRGLYFFGEWDKRYVPLLESADPGDEPKRGGLLTASYGRGTYVYSGYSFFRQVPGAVPGAVRLFANLLAMAEVRILERAERLKAISMFSFMDEAQLYEVARLISERWLDAGSDLCQQGEQGKELFMVVDGNVQVLKRDGQEDRVVTMMGPGDVVGELAALTDLPRSATVRAVTDVKVLVMQGDHFRGFLRGNVDLAERLTSMLARRLASAETVW